MVRSGCVRSLLMAASPTTMVPSASRLTTEGQSVLPYGPGIHFGWPVCGSRYATRLLVVPRSIPTILPMIETRRAEALPLQKLLLNVGDQIPYVRTAIQQIIQLGHDLFSRGGVAWQSIVPLAGRRLQLRVNFTEFLLKIILGRFEA